MQHADKHFIVSSAGDGMPAVHRNPTARRFVAPDQCDWVVAEVPAPKPACGAERGECLIFSSAVAWRRVREFPADWRERSDADLWEISWHR